MKLEETGEKLKNWKKKTSKTGGKKMDDTERDRTKQEKT